MNWGAIGAISDIVAAFAVVVSLVYLSLQIRAQSRETHALAMHEIAAAFRENIGKFSEEGLADIVIKGIKDIGSLDEKERFILVSSMNQLLRVWEEAYIMNKSGRLDDDLWRSITKQYASFMGSPPVFYVWNIRKEFYNDGFREYVDSCESTEYKV